MNYKLIALILMVSTILVIGSTINSPSGSFVDVSNACAHASIGDTVTIPPGTNTWFTNINVTGISLIGAGTNVCQIVDETPVTGNGLPLINFNTSSNVQSVLSGIRFNVGVTNNYPNLCSQGECTNRGNAAFRGVVNINYGGGMFRCTSCLFYKLTGKPLHFTSGGTCLVDNDIITMRAGAQLIELDDAGFGDLSWSVPYTYGGTNGVTYIESCAFSGDTATVAIDSSAGARVVIRNCDFDGCYFNIHGSETSQRFRSGRAFEVYNNSFHYQTNSPFNNFYAAVDVRGGSGVFWSNVCNGYNQTMTINYYRATDNDAGFVPWFGACDPTGGYDKFVTANVSLASTATSNKFVVSAILTPNFYVGWTLLNTNKQNGTTNCGMVVANDAHTFTVMNSRNPQYQIYFTNGQTIEIFKLYPMFDMPGRGSGNLVSNDIPTRQWPGEVDEPIYVWGNQQFFNYNVPTPGNPNAGTTYPMIVEGRDYSNGFARPLYTPLQYPYPGITATNVPFIPGTAYMGSVGKYGQVSNMR